MKKEIGNIKTMSIHINNMKFDKMEFNKICIFVGPNGTGKTFVLILNWIVNITANTYIISKNLSIASQTLQFLLDKSFTNQDFTGPVEADFENLSLSFELDKGKVNKFNITTSEELRPSGMAVFMSKNTRTYDQVLAYLKTKKMLGLSKHIDLSSVNDIMKLSELYKIYDILFIEKLINKITPVLKFDKDTQEMFKTSYDLDVVSLQYDDEKTDITYTDSKNITKSTTMLGAGHQSVLNMSSMSMP